MTGLCQVAVFVYTDGVVRRTATKWENIMTTMKMGRRALMATAVATLGLGTPAFADGHQVLDSIHFLIPAVPVAAGMARRAEQAKPSQNLA